MAAYTELAGRRVRDNPDGTDYQTIGVSDTRDDVTAPAIGDADLSTSMSHTFSPTCVNVDIDEMSYPKRFLFVANWRSPKTRAEAQA